MTSTEARDQIILIVPCKTMRVACNNQGGKAQKTCLFIMDLKGVHVIKLIVGPRRHPGFNPDNHHFEPDVRLEPNSGSNAFNQPPLLLQFHTPHHARSTYCIYRL